MLLIISLVFFWRFQLFLLELFCESKQEENVMIQKGEDELMK